MYSLEPVFIHTTYDLFVSYALCRTTIREGESFLAFSQAVAQELNFFPPSASFSNKIHCSENVCEADIESGMIKIRIYSSFIVILKRSPSLLHLQPFPSSKN